MAQPPAATKPAMTLAEISQSASPWDDLAAMTGMTPAASIQKLFKMLTPAQWEEYMRNIAAAGAGEDEDRSLDETQEEDTQEEMSPWSETDDEILKRMRGGRELKPSPCVQSAATNVIMNDEVKSKMGVEIPQSETKNKVGVGGSRDRGSIQPPPSRKKDARVSAMTKAMRKASGMTVMSSEPTTVAAAAAAAAVDESGKTPVHHAVLLGTYNADDGMDWGGAPGVEVLEALERALASALASGHDVNHKDSSGKTALHYACSRKYEIGIMAAERLLKCPTIDLESVDKYGKTALHIAAELQEGWKPYSPWHATLIQMLLEAGANVNATVVAAEYSIAKFVGSTALHCACTIPVIELLLKGGANMRLADTVGCIALHRVDSPETAKLLLDHNGTNNKDLLDWPNEDGDTPLHCALFGDVKNNDYKGDGVVMQYGLDIPLAKYFVEAGADVFKPNRVGWKPIDSIPAVVKMEVEGGGTGIVSCELNDQIEFLTTLVPIMQEKVQQSETECDVDLSWSSIGGKMLLKVMEVFDGDDSEDIFDHIDPLISAGADLTYSDPKNGWNLFHCFVGGLHWRDVCAETWEFEDDESYVLDVMQRVLAHHPEDQQKALVGAKTSDGHTLLHFAAEKGQAKIAAWLLEKSLDVSSRDTNGWTPLHWACTAELNDGAILELLVQNGGMVTARTWKDKSGNRVSQTPWEIASAKILKCKASLDFLEHNPLVHQQLKEQCQWALRREWSSSLNGRLLESIFCAGPAGFAVAYEFLPGLVAPPTAADERTD